MNAHASKSDSDVEQAYAQLRMLLNENGRNRRAIAANINQSESVLETKQPARPGRAQTFGAALSAQQRRRKALKSSRKA
eukprot:6204659-Pleurochrysis_carterae.AAC.2